MYPWAKALCASIIIGVVALLFFIFQEPLLNLLADDEPVAPVPPVVPKKIITQAPEKIQKVKKVSPPVAPVVLERKPKPLSELERAQKLFESKKYLESKKILLGLLKKKKLSEKDELFWQVMGVLTEINRIIVTTDFYTPEKIRHNVVPGNRLSRMAKTYQTTVQNINRSNGRDINDSRIYVGKVFYIYPGFWKIKIIKSKHKLILYDKGIPFMVYDIADGRQNRTPVGHFKIKTKEIEPAWTAPGKNIPYGDPRNVLGSRWMGLEEQVENSQNVGYGIHGTNDPSSIGSSASNGCIRMNNRDVEELYDILPYGVNVEIVE
jgi:lipoprotein-anchoring transpeptidase ErfK/SrfK